MPSAKKQLPHRRIHFRKRHVWLLEFIDGLVKAKNDAAKDAQGRTSFSAEFTRMLENQICHVAYGHNLDADYLRKFLDDHSKRDAYGVCEFCGHDVRGDADDLPPEEAG